MPAALALGLAGSVTAATLVYLASPNQRLRRRRLPPVPCLIAAACLLVASVSGWQRAVGPVAGWAASVAALMTAWVLLPALCSMLRAGDDGK